MANMAELNRQISSALCEMLGIDDKRIRLLRVTVEVGFPPVVEIQRVVAPQDDNVIDSERLRTIRESLVVQPKGEAGG